MIHNGSLGQSSMLPNCFLFSLGGGERERHCPSISFSHRIYPLMAERIHLPPPPNKTFSSPYPKTQTQFDIFEKLFTCSFFFERRRKEILFWDGHEIRGVLVATTSSRKIGGRGGSSKSPRKVGDQGVF